MQQLLLNSYVLLSDSHKRKVIPFVLLLALGSAFDFFSLASFLPVILLIINPEQSFIQSILGQIQPGSWFHDPVHFGIALTIGALIFTLIKTQMQVWITYKKASYAYSIANTLASDSMANYLQYSYVRFSHTDYTHQMNRITNLPYVFANNIIIPSGTILSESLISLFLVACVAWYNPYTFIFLSLALIPIGIAYQFKRKNIKGISEEIKTTYPLLLKYTLQTIEGLLEIRAFRKENFFKTRFTKAHHSLGKIFSADHTANSSASRLTELIASWCVGALIIYALASRQSYTDTLLLLSLYAGLSFRIIPSINRIFSASLQIRTHEYVIPELKDMIFLEVDGAERIKDEGPPIVFKHSIELRNVSFAYADQPLILNNASLTIQKGEKIAIIGKSGVGKTSLLLILFRFIKESTGEIRIDGQKLQDADAMAWRKNIGYISQNPYLLDASVAENIAFGIPIDQIDLPVIEQLISDLDLNSWVDQLPNGLQTSIGEKGVKISGGQRQRLAIARALYQNSEILLLDEITNQLDKQTETEVMEIVYKGSLQKKTILLISHQLNHSKEFDSIYEFKNGRLEKVNNQVKTTV